MIEEGSQQSFQIGINRYGQVPSLFPKLTFIMKLYDGIMHPPTAVRVRLLSP